MPIIHDIQLISTPAILRASSAANRLGASAVMNMQLVTEVVAKAVQHR